MIPANEYFSKIDQHIRFLEKILQKPSITNTVRQELSHQLQRIKKRRADPNLYLAIIGEFSSGKSTFINALLRDDLLKTSALVATAIETKISYGMSFKVQALFRHTRPKLFIKKPTEPSEITTPKTKIAWFPSLIIWIPLMIWLSSISAWFLSLLLLPLFIVITTVINQRLKNQPIPKNPPIPSKLVTSSEVIEMGISPHQFVQMVTSEEELARALDGVKIYHPANFLKSGIVIIDTPGTNADNEEHGKITTKVIENEADAAVIIIPAGQPLSTTLISFLSGSISQYIHRCVFVISKMDTIRQKEQERLIKNIHKRLKDNLKIDNFLMIEAAPQIVLDMLNTTEEIDGKNQLWHDKFLELEKKLHEYLMSSREIAISESLSRLLTQVFRQSESHLQTQQEQFRRKQEAIESEVIRDLPSFTNEQYRECSTMIKNTANATKSKVEKIIIDCQENIESQLRGIIFGAQNKDELKNILENRIYPVFNNAPSTLDASLKSATNELNISFNQVKKHFDQKFSLQYSKLKALSSNTNLDKIKATQGNMQISTSSVMSVASEIGKAAGDKSGRNVGAGAGAALGTLVLPGVGTVVGAVLGGIFGSLFGPSLSELQNRSWNELQPKIQNYFKSAKKTVEQSLIAYSQQMESQLNNHIDTYITTYQAIVNAMQQEQKEQKEGLARLQQDIQADLLEINSRIKSLEVHGLYNANQSDVNTDRE
ncbi:dynamin family protein [Anabaena sp. UHCC 0451]|uniref:dynamin family protein n=1 Tax=Anabaena sp. UHCC 0451 TaxID=2055235 RepID=UPI002B21AFEE|nr:dynamin family protein [Anabaena sp. UHCC 0451]MEA5577834.1 dynamin family protein [Anabaena sp. UHCC 0451]